MLEKKMMIFNNAK